MCGRALSCWKIPTLCCCKYGTKTASVIPSHQQNSNAFNLPACSLFLTVLLQTLVPVAFLNKRPNFRLERNLFCQDEVARKRSSRGMHLRNMPDMGRSAMFPVCSNLFSNPLIVNSWHWKCQATSLADMPAVSIPMALSRCSNVIPGWRGMTSDFQDFFPVFVLTIRKLSHCLLCDPAGDRIICFAVHMLHMIFINVKTYDYIMA